MHMAKRTLLFALVTILFLGVVALAQMTPTLQWTFLPSNIMNEIIGESSGENAMHAIMETGGYDKVRPASEYGPSSMFHETKYFLDKFKEYGIPGTEVARYPGGTAWNGVKGELWELEPGREKLASYTDMSAMLASGSETCDVTGELVWVGSGRPEDRQGKDLKDKVVVTDGALGGYGGTGAVGVIGIGNSRLYFDPMQLNWASIGGRGGGGRGGGGRGGEAAATNTVKFGFQIPPRDGDYLRKRLLAGQKIKVRAQVVSETLPTDLQNVVAYIPGTDTNGNEVIFSAHLFEGYVKQGGNDDISGCAALMETARVLNTLINENRIPRPKRTIRFIIGPEMSGTGAWARDHKEIMARTLCNINLDMVGEWLSKNQSFFCLMRTTYGNPHYVNDVMENYYRYVGESNREHLQNRGNFTAQARRIVAPTGADEPFLFSIETYYGASDHTVFNDWGVGVPGIMMIAWPDRWYHTSGDHVDKSDATQMKRVTIIAAAAAYTIAGADDYMAMKIAGEIGSNGTNRLGHQLVRGLEELNRATAADYAEAYRLGRAFISAAVLNERDTLASIHQLAVDKKVVGEYVAAVQKSIDDIGRAQLNTLENHMKAVARRLNTAPIALQMTELERQAAKVIPRPTAKVKERGQGGYRYYLTAGPAAAGTTLTPEEIKVREAFNAAQAKFPVKSMPNASELQLLINGRHSALDIKNMLDAQYEIKAPPLDRSKTEPEYRNKADLQDILNYLEQLRAVGLIEM
jgi:aminopeptidase YwaD